MVWIPETVLASPRRVFWPRPLSAAEKRGYPLPPLTASQISPPCRATSPFGVDPVLNTPCPFFAAPPGRFPPPLSWSLSAAETVLFFFLRTAFLGRYFPSSGSLLVCAQGLSVFASSPVDLTITNVFFFRQFGDFFPRFPISSKRFYCVTS